MDTLIREKRKAARPSATVTLRDTDLMKRIAETAYDLWQQRGCPQGDDLHDWCEAEKIVMGRKRS